MEILDKIKYYRMSPSNRIFCDIMNETNKIIENNAVIYRYNNFGIILKINHNKKTIYYDYTFFNHKIQGKTIDYKRHHYTELKECIRLYFKHNYELYAMTWKQKY